MQSNKYWYAKQQVLEDPVNILNERYEALDPLTGTLRDIHDYLGMTLDYCVPGGVTIRMDNYVSDFLERHLKTWEGQRRHPLLALSNIMN
jgi:hypothetical protein